MHATKTELLEVAALFERVLAGESVRGIVTSSPTWTLSKVRSRVEYMGKECMHHHADERIFMVRSGDYTAHREAFERALANYRAWLAPAPEANPVAWLRERAKGDLAELPDRARQCLRNYLGVRDKAGLVEAVRAGKVTRDIPNLGEKSYKAILAFAGADANP